MAASVTLNERAFRLADHMASNAGALRIHSLQLPSGARVLDCGVLAEGGLQAGLALARVCCSGQAEVSLVPGDIAGIPCPQIQVATDQPVSACLASQYAGWQIKTPDYNAMGSGPMRCIWGEEKLFDKIPGKESAPVAVGILESRKLPDDKVVKYLSDNLKLPANKITLLVARASSLAGTIQVVARALETTLHKLHFLKFNLTQIVSGFAVAPLPPVAVDDNLAIGRTNDAILYGGRVSLWVKADDNQLADLGPQVTSASSPDHGTPTAQIFERYGHDFYKIDPRLFSPAQVVFHNLKTGMSHGFGRLEAEVLLRSFFT